MRLVGINSLKSGDTLSMALNTNSGKIILNEGVTLTDVYIEKLRQLGIDKVYINDGRFDDVEVVQHLDAKTKKNATQIIRDSYDKLHKSKAIDEFALKDIAREIVEYVRDAKDKGANILSTNCVDDYVVEHSINVAILTAYLGNSMSFNYSQLCDLVAGAVIHDLGRENISDEKPEHAQKGFDAMRKCRGLSLRSSIICYEHHENYDGSGYPRKLKGSAISEFTRIVRVADVYDNVLHGYENDNKKIMPHQAYEYVMALSGKVLDPEFVEKFRDTIIFYPNGCTILLSNALRGVVVKQNHGSPQRPIVRVYNDSNVIGEIDLMKSLTLFIKDVVIS